VQQSAAIHFPFPAAGLTAEPERDVRDPTGTIQAPEQVWHVSSKWLTDSVAGHTVLDLADYVVKGCHGPGDKGGDATKPAAAS